MLEQLRNDLSIVESKYTETGKLVLIAAKYGIQKAGRVKMQSELINLIVQRIREIRAKNTH